MILSIILLSCDDYLYPFNNNKVILFNNNKVYYVCYRVLSCDGYSYPYPCPGKVVETSYCTHLLLKPVIQSGLGMGMGMNGTAHKRVRKHVFVHVYASHAYLSMLDNITLHLRL